jgi:hypothetical protein
MTDWTFAEQKPSDELAQLHFFSMQKIQDERSIEFRIAVYEYATKNHLSMRFLPRRPANEPENVAVYACGWARRCFRRWRSDPGRSSLPL